MALEEAIRTGRAGHAYIIAGEPERAMTDAGRFAGALVCRGPDAPCGECPDCRKAKRGVHPDITVLESPNVEIKIEELRSAVLGPLYIRPNEAARRVFIIAQARKLNDVCQNALLKALEEPPDYAVLLLVTDNADALLPTVRSRCGIVRLPPESGPEPHGRALELLGAVTRGSELDVLTALSGMDKLPRADFMAIADSCADILGQALRVNTERPSPDELREYAERLGRDRIIGLIRAVESARYLCGRYLSLPLVTGALAARIGGIMFDEN